MAGTGLDYESHQTADFSPLLGSAARLKITLVVGVYGRESSRAYLGWCGDLVVHV